MKTAALTRAGLARARARGVKLGGSLPQCDTLTPMARARGQTRSAVARQARALKSAEVIARLVTAWRDAEPDLSLRQIAERLNSRRRRTPRGKSWTPTQVRRALDRAGKTAAAVERPEGDRPATRRTA
jgi:hypothetical protein